MPQSIPKVAQVEDYDSDESSVKPGTRKEARRRTPAAPPPKALSRYKSAHGDGASDSGYSSRTSGTHASNASVNAQTAGPVQPPSRPATSHGQIKAKPVIHRTENQSTRPRPPSRSASTSRRSSEQCDDPNCRHSACFAVRYPGRRFSTTQSQAPQYAPQYAASPSTYQQAPQYQYAQVSQAQSSQTVPTLSSFPQPRPRSGSTSRQARPMSIHGYPFATPSGTSTPGPPPAASAYQNIDLQGMDPQWAQWYQQAALLHQQQRAYQVQQQQQQAAYAAAANQAQAYSSTQPSPLQASPTSPKFSASARLQRAYSARMMTPVSATATAAPNQFPSGLSRTPSNRQPSARAYNMPGAFPGADVSSSDSDSSSEDSSSDISEEEYERERRARARDSRLMSSSSQRRPSMSKYRTEPVVPTQGRLAREMLTRNPRSDHVLDYVSSSDNMDSDRTTRAMVDRPRATYTDSTRSSRRPSLSTTASSGRTRATTMSSATSGMASMVLESKSGRQISYLSKREQAKYACEREEEEQRRLENIEAYQDAMRGGKLPELTAEKLKMQQMHSSGHSYAHSRKSSRSSSRAYNPNEGLRIESGGTTIHVYGDQKVEMIPSRDGGAASLVIGSRSGRESTYLGDSSKSSGSRQGRSHAGSDVGTRREQVIQEEYGTEQPTI